MPSRRPVLWLSAETAGTVAASGGIGTVEVDFTVLCSQFKRWRLHAIRSGKTASNIASQVSEVRAGGVAVPGTSIMFGNDWGPVVVDQELCAWTERKLAATVVNSSAGVSSIAVSFGVQEVDDGT